MEEEFREVPGYEGLYQVSNLARVKSLPKFKKNRLSFFYTKEKIFNDRYDSNGYKIISLSKDKKIKILKTHQLVAIAFLNHKIDGMNLVVDHIDNCKSNNKIDNLQIVTNRFNCSKDKKNKTSKYTGVRWHIKAQKWSSQIYYNGKAKHLGLFTNEEEASNVYQNKLKEIK